MTSCSGHSSSFARSSVSLQHHGKLSLDTDARGEPGLAVQTSSGAFSLSSGELQHLQV